jgi:hypothetical protein
MEKKEKYQISTSVNEGILEIIITGKIIVTSVEKLSNKTIAVIKKIVLIYN